MHQEAEGQIADGIVAIRTTNTVYARERDHVYSQFAQKISNTEELKQQLSSRLKSCRSCIEQSDWSLKKLNEGLQALVAPTELNSQRLAVRMKRPARELVFDVFQQALVAEQKELEHGRARLKDAVIGTRRLLEALKQTSVELSTDLKGKMNALDIDTFCVDKKVMDTRAKLDKLYHRKSVQATSDVFHSARETHSSFQSEGRAQERNRQVATLRGVQAEQDLERMAKERWQANSEVFQQVANGTGAAFKATQAGMGAKIEHTETLRQELLKQRKVTEAKIFSLQKWLHQAGEKIDFIETPMSANTRRSEIRTHRVHREAAVDEVSEALSAQQNALAGSRSALQRKVAEMHASLNNLKQADAELVDDINSKEQALAIDRQCAGFRNGADSNMSFGFAKIGQGQQYFAGTASSMIRQIHTPPSIRPVSR